MKRLVILPALLAACVFLLAACASGTPSESDASGGTGYHKITAGQAKEKIDAGGVTVVDVRTKEEYAAGHIPGAVLVPNESIAGEPPAALPDKDAVLLVHCRTGVRSKQAADKLAAMGYTQVYDFGGIVDWTYPTESGAAE